MTRYVKIQRDKKGRFIVLGKRKYRIGKNVTKTQLQRFVQAKIKQQPVQPYHRDAAGENRVLTKILEEKGALQKLAEGPQDVRATVQNIVRDEEKKHEKQAGWVLLNGVPTYRIPDAKTGEYQYVRSGPSRVPTKPPARIPVSVNPPALRHPRIISGPPAPVSPSNPARIGVPLGQLRGPKSPEKKGQGKAEKEGISNFDIDRMLSRQPEYLGCVARDEFRTKILPKVLERSKGGCVINMDFSHQAGSHWVALYWDGSPGVCEIDYFDSFAEPIPTDLQADLKLLAEKLNCQAYLKLKENRIKKQSERSSNCGFFATKFLLDRFRGKPFIDASGFSDVRKGESQISNFKAQQGFGYIASFDQGSSRVSVGKGVFDVYTDFPPKIKAWINADVKITSISVCRKPISSNVEKAIDLFSAGKFAEAKAESGYDKMFHLYLFINGEFALERNETIQLNRIQPDSETECIPLNIEGRLLTSKFLMENSLRYAFNPTSGVPDNHYTRAEQLAKINRYDPFRNNCQDFVLSVLRGSGLGNNQIYRWVKQPTEVLLRKIPVFTQSLASFTTDLAARARRFFGLGRIKIAQNMKNRDLVS